MSFPEGARVSSDFVWFNPRFRSIQPASSSVSCPADSCRSTNDPLRTGASHSFQLQEKKKRSGEGKEHDNPEARLQVHVAMRRVVRRPRARRRLARRCRLYEGHAHGQLWSCERRTCVLATDQNVKTCEYNLMSSKNARCARTVFVL